jgi:(2Fe-2S) ferredoxin
MPLINSPAELDKFRQGVLAKRDPNTPCVSVCAGAGCVASGANEVIAAFRAEIEKQGVQAGVETKGTGCPGFCERGPVVVIYPEEICYLQVTAEDVPEIVEETIVNKRVVERLVYVDPATDAKAALESDIPFYKYQERHLLGSNIRIDPKRIDDYLAIGGYSALTKALTAMSPEAGAGGSQKIQPQGKGRRRLPGGTKWEGSRNAPEKIKYVIVNADEGDPGAFMDRALLEGNPHSILEGLTIGGYAIGAHEGFIYVRQEYPLAVENINLAIQQAKEYGLLGKTSWVPALISRSWCTRAPAPLSAANPPR